MPSSPPTPDNTSTPVTPRSAGSDSAHSKEAPDCLSEDELEALRNRNPETVQRYIYGNKDYLRNVLRRYTRSDEAARDLLQETFFQALRSLPDFRGESKLTTWLYSIAKNVALARYRKDKRRTALDQETLTRVAARRGTVPNNPSGAPPSWDPSEETTRNEEKALIHDALDDLSSNYRKIIELRDLQELSTKEVAEQLGLTRVNVRVRLHRAHTKLEDAIEARVDPDYQMAD